MARNVGEAGPKSRSGWLWRGVGWLYLGGLALSAGLVGWLGEEWPLTTAALYLPRLPLLAPLLVLGPALYRVGARRLLALHAVAGLVVLGPIMGLHLSLPRHSPPDSAAGDKRPAGTPAPHFRLLSYNVWYGYKGSEAIRDEVNALAPDVVVFQAMRSSLEAFFRRDLFKGWHVEANGEFLIASRYPIIASDDHPAADEEGVMPAHARYTVDSPLGLIDVFATHPISPRPGLEALRGRGFRHVLRHGVSQKVEDRVDENTFQRERQVMALAKAAAVSKHPVIIAGDTNLPEGSRIYREQLGHWQDGFATVGNGYGFTYPANKLRPWLRIDRILAGRELRFTSFSVGGRGGSDHCPVAADFERATP